MKSCDDIRGLNVSGYRVKWGFEAERVKQYLWTGLGSALYSSVHGLVCIL